MLVLQRKINERIVIQGQIVITVVRIMGDTVRLGIEAPADVVIDREEVHRRRVEDATQPPNGRR
jgi:carbon storage regulator